MHVWRITRRAHQALDGEGARLYGGRWNAEGTSVVYTSSTLALAALEYLVHVDPQDVPDDLIALRLKISDVSDVSVVETVRVDELPNDWNAVDDHPGCVARGTAWVQAARALALRVPSAIVPEETNVLLNPKHRDMGTVEVDLSRAFAFDPRLLV